MRLGTQDKDFFPKDLTGKFTYLKDIGFECFEIDGKVLLEQTDLVMKAQKESGLIISSVCGGYEGWIGDFIEERRLNAVEQISRILEVMEAFGIRGIVLPAAWGMFTYRLPPMVSPRSVEGDRKAIKSSLDVLDEVAGRKNVKIFLEPLNRYQDHMLNTLSDAAKVILDNGYKNVLITADFYHMNIDEDEISEALRTHKDLIGHVHIAENHRYQPGTGSIDFEKHFRTLFEIGYRGAIVNEGRVRGMDPRKAYEVSVQYTKEILDLIQK